MSEVVYKPDKEVKEEIKTDVFNSHVKPLLPIEHIQHVRLQGADLLAIAFLAGVLYAIIVFKLMD